MKSQVVICFRSLNLWYLAQLSLFGQCLNKCCDLLSFFEFMIFGTTRRGFGLDIWLLWFAFVLWIYDIWHNYNDWKEIDMNVVICFRSLNLWYLAQQVSELDKRAPVVICFRSLNLWYLAQHCASALDSISRCDLLSFFEFMIFGTTICSPSDVYQCCDLLSFFEFMIFGTTTN